jgi:adenylate cyclase
MPDKVYSAEMERRVAAPEPLVWALLADSHRRNRMVGYKPASYDYQRTVADDPNTRTRIGRAWSRTMGMELSWVEVGEAIEGRFLWGERQFVTGPMRSVGFRFAVEPDANSGTRVKATVYLVTFEATPEALAMSIRNQFEKQVSAYLDALMPLLAEMGALPSARDASEPPSSLARRLLFALDHQEARAGDLAPADEQQLTFYAKRFAASPVEAAVRERIVEHLRTRPDDDVRQMRPFELARAWGFDRKEVLRGFLYAAQVGLVDLHWQLNCPTCRVGAGVAESLLQVKRAAHCDECNIEFGLDFAENVEAVFDVNPTVRKIANHVYCASSPWFRPHVYGVLRLQPHATREVTGSLPAGILLVRAMRAQRRAAIAIDESPPALLEIRVTPTEIRLSTDGRAADTKIRVINETGEDCTLQLERSGWNADIVLGSVVITQPEFLDLFGTEAPAAGVDLTVSSLTVLFSDLTGTTALYEKVGDARAFALVQEHFRDVAQVAARNEGAVVKTMGDAVMATFTSPAHALAAALEMVARVQSEARAHELDGFSIKIGLHEGPCLVVRANNRIDFFGTTVNIAARLQGQARANRVVIAAELMEHPDVEALVSGRGLRVEQFRAELKGVREVQALLAIDSPTS